MFNFTTTANVSDMEATNTITPQSLHSWSMCIGMFADEYERFLAIGSERRAKLQPLPASTAAGFVC